jgi:phage terminase small subunit
MPCGPDAGGFSTYQHYPKLTNMPRNRTPTAILDAKGAFNQNPGRARPTEPTTDKPIGGPPNWLSSTEKTVWHELVKQSLPGVLMESDRLMFAVLVRLAAKFRSGDEPMMGIEIAQMISLSSRFAMTPADRSKVTVEKKPTSSLTSFLQSRDSKVVPIRPN